MAWTDLERRRDGILGSAPSLTGSYRQNEIPYTYSGAATSETRVQFTFQSEWFQISATSSDAVKYAFEYGGTGGTKHMVIAGNTSSPVISAAIDELYILNDYSVVAKCGDIVSGSNSYSIDERS